METTTYIQHTCTVHEHRLDVPLDHADPGGAQIRLFAREVIRPGGEDLPHLLFLQGGPGGAGPRQGDFREGWIGRALETHRVVLMDQRGTGQSTYLDWQALGQLDSDEARAAYLRHFLQAAIIQDAEILRREIAGGAQWTTLGQSYGGFLTVAYLSAHPEALRTCLVTGGLPALTHVDDNYRLTYPLTAARNREYLARYRDDEQTIRTVAAHLRDTEEILPDGSRLSPTRFRTIGGALGMQTAYDMLHYTFEDPFTTVRGQRRLSAQFLADIQARVTSNPMYWTLQEAIYAGATPALAGTATNWSADRLSAEFDGFHLDADPLDMSQPWYLTGEHIFIDTFREDPTLAPLFGTADLLAKATDFEPVYLPGVLAANDVPVAAAIYHDDMFVPREHQLATAAAIRGARTWVTSEYQHDGVRASAGQVFDHLWELARD